MSKCIECGSYAINPHCHGREARVNLDLCDVCYWRKRATEAQARIKELETPDMFWNSDYPEDGSRDSPYEYICDGDYDDGIIVEFFTAKSLDKVSVRVLRNEEGDYDYEYINETKENPELSRARRRLE